MKKTTLICMTVIVLLISGTSLFGQAAATTGAASEIGCDHATLNGTVNANNDSTTVTFEYGFTTAYGTTVTADQSPVTGSTNTAVSAAITGLDHGTVYHYRVVAANPGGTAYGSDMIFSTPTAIPSQERAALIAIYNSTDGDNWINNNNWKTINPGPDGFSECGSENSWYGISCGSYVYGIALDYNNLVGAIPQEIGDLTSITSLNFTANQLSGPIPTVVGNLVNLTSLRISNNELTGSIPLELGDLVNLTVFECMDNQLTGSIPPELGNLVNLTNLIMQSNQLSGSIPIELSYLTQLDILFIYNNQLTDPIPPELGNLTSLRYLNIGRNALSGEIPTTLTNLISLTYLNIQYNALYTNNSTLRAFLDGLDSGWADYQTVAPTDPSAATESTTSVMLGWTPIAYIWNTGGYRVFYGTSPGGPYTYYDITTSKTVSQMEVTGLTPDTQYYFVVQTHTDAHPNNQNALDSENSMEISASPSSPGIPPQERAALIALYNSTDGDNWTDNTGWKTPPLAGDGFALNGTEDGWYGITVVSDSVTEIALNSKNLAGTIPPELGNLANLTHLSLYLNQLTGTIPIELGSLSNLQILYLSSNQLTGSIPTELGNLSNLTLLRLSDNQLTGSIPTQLGNLSNLTQFTLSGQLTGTIPAELGSLSNLEILILKNSQLTGTIPTELGNLANLTHLHLDSNQLTGSIPAVLGNLSNLTYLSLQYNQLTGSIPIELGNLSNLTHLTLQYNQLTGIIPTELAGLSSLTHLHLESNQLTGIIPTELGNLSNLMHLYLYSNQLTGSIPTELGNLSNLTYLSLQYNQLTGIIPTELGNLSNLRYLFLYSNQLTGSIPPQLGNLSNLIQLRLRSNQLTGSIPSQLGNLSNLQRFYLNGNALSGEIPGTLTNLTNLMANETNIGYNSLYTADAGLISFLNSKDPDWASTQTVGPTAVSAAALTATSIRVSWTPIVYTGNPGGYIVSYSTGSGGPYTPFATQTTDKSQVSLDVTGLTHSTQYSFIVQTRTEPHGSNANDLYSEYSMEISASTSSPGIPPQERAALIALYNSTDGDNWTDNTGWKTPPLEADGFAAYGSENTWYGVTCDGTNTKVTVIDLNNNNLAGVIPTTVEDLPHLTDLDLANNQLTGTIPTALGNLSNLIILNLQGNQLPGTIPAELGNLSSLQQIILNHNQLTGTIPGELGNLSNLQVLWITYNQLTGTIPTELGSLSNLQNLNLLGNQLSGNIPTELGNLSNLQYFSLSGNQLSGTIPTELGNLSNLLQLDLRNNQLTGTIPTQLGNLSNLQTLSLYLNQLTGSIPTQLGNLSNLINLSLNNNRLTGSIPGELGNLSSLQDLDLRNNQLSGSIPTALTNLTGLTQTNIGYNALYTVDAGLITFLNTEDPDWADTQTIAPTNLMAAAQSATSVSVSWDPIAYIADNGGYRVFYSIDSGVSYTLFDTTTDKTVSQMEVTGLDPGTQYSFVIQTRTDPHTNNQNTLDSEYSMEISASTSPPSIPPQERTALIALYNSTDGDNWTDNTGWKTPPLEADGFAAYGSENTWFGIACDGTNTKVTVIDLNNNNLAGVIPTTVEDLPHLTDLDLANNQLTGTIPMELGTLANLDQLVLSTNQLSGTIPPELGNLSNLQSLSLHRNQLTGSIPPELGNLSNLHIVYLHENQLTGSIPSELGNLAAVQGLYFMDNQLTGAIPPELGNLTNISYINFRGNQLTESIPPALGNLSNLQSLYLYGNRLTGSIPPELGGLSNLRYLWLHGNRLTGNIPTQLSNLSSLQNLSISGNALSGEIPATLTALTSLTGTDIGYNALYTADAGLITFLNGKDPDWAATQTIAPTNPAAAVQSPTSISVSWDPIPYTSDNGSYRVFYSTASGEPYDYFAAAAGKTVSQMEITSLTPGITYYFVVQTRTDPHTVNQNTVDSEYSQEVSATISDIAVISPEENEVYNARNTISIQWDAVAVTGDVEIRLFRTDPPGEEIVGTPPAAAGFMAHTVHEDTMRGIYYIEVRQGDLFDRSGNFYIDNQSSVIRVTSPSAGQTFNTGDSLTIDWESVQVGGTVEITLCRSSNGTVVETVEGQRVYDDSPVTYIIPGTVSTGDHYIKVRWGTVSGRSGDFFIN